jgi:hypothetical protein
MLGKHFTSICTGLLMFCLAALGVVGCAQGSSAGGEMVQAMEKGYCFGLWAGNVETIPERPTQLPQLFFTEAPATADVPLDYQGRPLYVDPATIKKPLWVFADQVDLLSISDQIHAAQRAGRPIVVLGADAVSIAKVFGESVGANPAGVPAGTVAWSSLPWSTQPLSRGFMTAEEGFSREELQAVYYLFMASTTLEAYPPETTGS